MSRSGGRPSKLTPETTAALTEALEEGDTYVVACAAAGIHYMTFRGWMRKGEGAKQGEYFEFFYAVRAAEMVARGKMERRAVKESKPLEYLERRHPQDWGKKDKVDITGDINVPITIEIINSQREADGDA